MQGQLKMISIMGYSSCTAYPLTQAHSTIPLHFIALTIMMVYHKADNSFTELFKYANFTVSASTVDFIHMTLIATLHIPSITISSGTILRLYKPQDCIKHICPDQKKTNKCISCIHSSSWRLSSKFYTLCECFRFSAQTDITEQRTRAHPFSWGTLPHLST